MLLDRMFLFLIFNFRANTEQHVCMLAWFLFEAYIRAPINYMHGWHFHLCIWKEITTTGYVWRPVEITWRRFARICLYILFGPIHFIYSIWSDSWANSLGFMQCLLYTTSICIHRRDRANIYELYPLTRPNWGA